MTTLEGAGVGLQRMGLGTLPVVYTRGPQSKPLPLTPGSFCKPVSCFLASPQQPVSFLCMKPFVIAHCILVLTIL